MNSLQDMITVDGVMEVDMQGTIDTRGLCMLVYEIVMDALIDYKAGRDGWLIEHFDETLYARLSPYTTKRLKAIASRMPDSENRTEVKKWMYDNKVFNLISCGGDSMTSCRLSQILHISQTRACTILRRLCDEGKIVKNGGGTYCIVQELL